MNFGKEYEFAKMSIEEFKVGLLTTESSEEMLLRTDENGCIIIGVRLNENEVLIVATTTVYDVIDKILYWSEKIPQILQFKNK